MARTTETKPTTTNATRNQTMTADQRCSRIQLAAYLRAEKRGFQGGDPMHDWIEAEREIDATLKDNSRRMHAGTN
ncbi:MAG: hypothetical protein A2289_02605 [Deltaproteobacteria bacterium RIFOXYA12_FULL_58_15]|nr:MAG: hypothetical protein A2289_02605 [Deltaproteobacteria bacterium RIFOXYA12_FULL_58_15]OGR11092.1 MAG: hypothetical protein A2341_07985 [Deltaproteobacteria bacterium RIFOXYB12_FULL_58_9]